MDALLANIAVERTCSAWVYEFLLHITSVLQKDLRIIM